MLSRFMHFSFNGGGKSYVFKFNLIFSWIYKLVSSSKKNTTHNALKNNYYIKLNIQLYLANTYVTIYNKICRLFLSWKGTTLVLIYHTHILDLNHVCQNAQLWFTPNMGKAANIPLTIHLFVIFLVIIIKELILDR